MAYIKSFFIFFKSFLLSHFDRIFVWYNILLCLQKGIVCMEGRSGPVNTPCEPPQTGERNGRFLGMATVWYCGASVTNWAMLLRHSCSGWLTDWQSVRESRVVSTEMLKFEVFHCCAKRKSPSDAGNGTATVFQKCQIPRAYSPSPQPWQESKHLQL